MNAALDDVAFLANSANRVAVLRALADRPHHRNELLDRLDASRITLTRVLNDLEERNWIERTGQHCEVTPLGAWVADEFTGLLETMSAGRRLREVQPWLPTDHVSFDVRRLCDATIVVPTQNDISAHVLRGADSLRSARRARVLSYQTAQPIVEAIREAVVERGQRFEGVFSPGFLETVLNDSAMAPPFAELLDAPAATIRIYEDDIPLVFFVTDETVGLSLTDDEGVARALVLSEDETVHDWAADTFDRYRARAKPVESSAFSV